MVTKLPVSTYYYHLAKGDQPNKDGEIEQLILDIFKELKETYGYRRIKENLDDIILIKEP